jgi:thiol:disulfide interchange protein DsbD
VPATSFTFGSDPAFELVGDVIQITKPEIKFDTAFEVNVGQFKNLAVFGLNIKILKPESFTVKAQVEYTCCNAGSCIPPNQVQLEIEVNPPAEKLVREQTPPQQQPKTQIQAQTQTQTQPESLSSIAESQVITEELSGQPENPSPAFSPATSDDAPSSLWIFLLMALSAGFLSVLTPCVYPMIPMTIAFFMRGEQKRSAGIVKALIFGLSIILIYTSLGIIVALSKNAAITNQITGHWLTNLIFAAIFIIFALSFFGLFEITLPGSLANKIDRKADRGGYVSAFFMALALTIISFSCTGPFVGSILVSSAQGLAVKPILGMFAFGSAFALPFTLLAFFPAIMKKMPKSGGWMNSVKIVFAFIMLAFAVYFLSYADKSLNLNIISRDVFLCIWIVLFALTGYYLLGKIRFAHDSEIHHTGVTRLLMAAASFVFALYLFTGLLGAPLQAISGLLPAAKENRTNVGLHTPVAPSYNRLCGVPRYGDHSNLGWPLGLQGYFDYDEAIACAKKQNKPLLMIFKGHGCAKCREMETNVWPDAEIFGLMNSQFVLLALYTDDNSPLPENEYVTSAFDGKVKKTMGQKNADFEITRYGINTFPYYAILDTNGEDIVPPTGYTKKTEEFKNWLEKGVNSFVSE